MKKLLVCAGACALAMSLFALEVPRPPRVTVDFTKEVGTIKPMNAGNNGPKRHRRDQMADNFYTYKMLHIPYARLHDANLAVHYGAPHTIDVWGIFKDPSADPTDPKNYDFVMTDVYLKSIVEAGTEPYYRLGGSIEHNARKFFTCMPVDYQKFAVICEHIIRHVTGDFADGLNMKVTYWEIWNEADLDREDSPNKRCWQGTADEFFDLFCTTFLHLKKTFPALKIGGPAAAGALRIDKNGNGWTDRLFKAMEKRGVKLDFYSWHNYDTHPDNIVKNCRRVRDYLDSHGQKQAESHLNEWNYVKDWSDGFVYSCHQIAEIKGAAFALATMLACQHEKLDMLMYYDFRFTTAFCGLWKQGTYERQKPWWSYFMFDRLARLGTEVESQVTMPETYAVAAKDGNGRKAAVVCFFGDNDNFGLRDNVRVKFAGLSEKDRDAISVRVLDNDLDCSEVPFNFVNDELTLDYPIRRNAALLVTF